VDEVLTAGLIHINATASDCQTEKEYHKKTYEMTEEKASYSLFLLSCHPIGALGIWTDI